MRCGHISLGEALKAGPPPAGNLAVPVFAHGTLAVELYTPVGVDRHAVARELDDLLCFDGERVFAGQANPWTCLHAAWLAGASKTAVSTAGN